MSTSLLDEILKGEEVLATGRRAPCLRAPHSAASSHARLLRSLVTGRSLPQALPCTLLHEGRHLAMLDPTARQPELPLEEGTQLKLPIWLVKSLVGRGHVEVQLPKCYGPVWRNALRANAGHQDLGSQYENYFDVGVQLLQLVDENELGDLGKELLTGFSSRFHGLLDAALNLTDQIDSSALKHKLTLREKNIFDTGRDASQGWHRWKSERTRAKIEPSTLVGNKRKHGAQTA
ncbi:DNA replication complex gins protein psf3 [Chrysochromulina tobinii]|uniref:DNA replication complex gins protein psf3 n=1 Tax=Chrysochromulina tobinii TaxID=1460289 RepID=A0A0M0K152_9EUKA|nr:DNA replication complex gins protein psf3 [Chrysochromulina tobinii]|eukprot:KOO32606.1 DNA replication complex gins protein psf3 [Chrysochromulina sp. CCMP291]